VYPRLTAALTAYPVVVLDGCDGTGKTTLAEALRDQCGYAVIHSGRTPDGTDIAERYRQLLAGPEPFVLDRSFISELVYGPLFHGQSRITAGTAASLAGTVATRGGVLVHLTGDPDTITTRLRVRDGTAPARDQISGIVGAYEKVFSLLEQFAPVLTADTTAGSP
jgi:predicted ATPase